MKNIIIITLTLAIMGFAAVGVLYIFEVRTMAESREMLIKIESAIFLFGGTVALILLLAGLKKTPEDDA